MSVLDKTPAQIAALKINTLSDEDISALTTAQLAALTAAQIKGLSVAQAQAFDSSQIQTLKASQVVALPADFSVLIGDQRPRPPPDLLDAPSLASRGGLAIGGK